MLRGMLDRFDHRPRDEFDVDATGFDQLRTSVDRWRLELTDLIRSVERIRRTSGSTGAYRTTRAGRPIPMSSASWAVSQRRL